MVLYPKIKMITNIKQLLYLYFSKQISYETQFILRSIIAV